MSNYPETDRDSPDTIRNLIETFAHLTDAEIAEVLDRRTGLASICRFIPTGSDVMRFVADRRASREDWKNKLVPHTSWDKLSPNAEPAGFQRDPNRRKAFVKAILGYNPGGKSVETEKRPLTSDNMPEKIEFKTPAKPASDELKTLLTTQGYGHLIAGTAHG